MTSCYVRGVFGLWLFAKVQAKITIVHFLTRKQRKKMHNHLRQNMCPEHPNRNLANGPNHPGPGPEEIPMVDVSI